MGETSRCNEDATRAYHDTTSEASIDRLVDGLARDDRVVLVVAHPDDETIGCGAHLSRWKDALTIVHVTNGSPPGDEDARAAGCGSAREYEALRYRELFDAMRVAHVGRDQLIALGIGDQRAVWSVAAIAERIAQILAEHEATIVVTQPYEGGHPDHDATALAVRLAVEVASSSGLASSLAECASYHSGPSGAIITGRFLPGPARVRTIALDEVDRGRRARMLACFVSQHHTLAPFGTGQEAFRAAPRYDFLWPPHAGCLYYEQYRWGVRDGAHWRRVAARQVAAFTRDASMRR